MRVTSNAYSTSLSDQLNRLVSRQVSLQNQVSSGQRVVNPDDDPAAFGRVLRNDASAQAVAQYQTNIGLLRNQASATYSAVNDLKKVSDRANEIATLADNTKSPEQLKLYAAEVTQLIQQAAQAANTQYNGEYLLGGTATAQTPFQVVQDAQGFIQSVAYQGNTGEKNVEIDENVTLSVTPPGANTTGAGARGIVADSSSGADLFKHLIDLQNHLQQGDTAAINGTDAANLSKDEDNLLYHMSANGAVQTRLDVVSAVMTSRASALKTAISNDSDVDMAKTITQLTQSQTAYSAALQTGAKLLNTSLLDYLR